MLARACDLSPPSVRRLTSGSEVFGLAATAGVGSADAGSTALDRLTAVRRMAARRSEVRSGYEPKTVNWRAAARTPTSASATLVSSACPSISTKNPYLAGPAGQHQTDQAIQIDAVVGERPQAAGERAGPVVGDQTQGRSGGNPRRDRLRIARQQQKSRSVLGLIRNIFPNDFEAMLGRSLRRANGG